MRQQINLFQESLRPRRVKWSTKQLGVIVMTSLVLLVLIESAGYWQTWRLQQRVAELEQTVASKQQQVKQVEAQYPRPLEDQRLLQRVRQLAEELDQKQRILGLLSTKEYGNTQGFADHLGGLSRQHLEGIWLTRLSIDKGGKQLGLAGGSMKPELVPRFIQRLGSEPSFAGKEFKTFLLSRTEKQNAWVDFNLHTEATAEQQP